MYNPLLNNLQKVIKDNLHILYSDENMKTVFPDGTINVTYKRGKCLKELISSSLFPPSSTGNESMVSKCNARRCDICENFLVSKNEFSSTVTGKKYKVRGNLSCKSLNVVYLITCKKCKQQYVGSALKDNFKARFRVHKSDINTGKDRCGVAKHFLTKCCAGGKLENIEIQLIEEVKEGNYDLEHKLWSREKYWQAQLFTLSHGMNSTWDWYSSNRKGYRKK